MELEQENFEKMLCTSMDFLNPRDVQAMYVIEDDYYILLNTGINLLVTKEIYVKAIKVVKKYYSQAEDDEEYDDGIEDSLNEDYAQQVVDNKEVIDKFYNFGNSNLSEEYIIDTEEEIDKND